MTAMYEVQALGKF